MLQGTKIKIRDIKEMQRSDIGTPKNGLSPLKKRKTLQTANTKNNFKEENRCIETVSASNIAAVVTKIAKKKLIKSGIEQTPSNQKRIDSYFASCPKTYDIKLPKEEEPFTKSRTQPNKTNRTKATRNRSTIKKSKRSPGRPKARRKRLFTDSTDQQPSTENMSHTKCKMVPKTDHDIECITVLDSDSEEETKVKEEILQSKGKIADNRNVSQPATNLEENQRAPAVPAAGYEIASVNSSPISASSLNSDQQQSKTSCEATKSSEISNASDNGRRKTKPCPPYKIIENTTFAVDAFQFGYINNVSHYFLTHFHADHYIGLTKSFSMPLFVSPVTARLLRAFIPVQEQYIHELDLKQSVVVNNIEITALDANHCPGSVMFVFKFLDTGKCILHTGDFRACHDMESEPIFWNNNIHTIYLDTTYISDKYAFCTQYESIEQAHELIDKFLIKHCWHRVLYVCGAYVIGKERFWSALAEELHLKVWTEKNRSKALRAINDERLNRLLVEDPDEANMHILPIGKVTYLELLEYFKQYEHKYDVLFALRPSGWEKDTKPRYGAKINLVGVEYSEHSSYAEMQRFVKFLKPEQVISTVPSGKNPMRTASVPQNWYKYDKLKGTSNYQPTLDSFLGTTPQNKRTTRLLNANKANVKHLVAAGQTCVPKNNNELNNNVHTDKAISIDSSQPAKNSDNIEVVRKDNSPTNAQNHTNLIKKEIIPLAKSVTSSSEDFEKSDFIIKTQKNCHRTNKKDFKEKVLTKTKSQRNQKQQLLPKKTSTRSNKIKSETPSPTPDDKLKTGKNKSQTENNSSGKELNDVSDRCTTQRVTRSQNSSNKSTNHSPQTKSSQYAGDSLKSPASQNKSKTKSIDSITNDKIASHDMEFAISQKRMTRSKTASTKTSDEHDFEIKLLRTTQQNNIRNISNTRSQLKSEINLNASLENPILKSSTDSSVDRLSHDDDIFDQINSSTIKANFLDDFAKLPRKSNNHKRPALIDSLPPPLKKAKPISLTAQTILNTILEHTEDIDRFNCSQLAGLVVETVNQQNPDNSKDHIPADLLSDADDDWM